MTRHYTDAEMLAALKTEFELALALTEAKFTLQQTLEYVFSWRSPSEAQMKTRIDECLEKIEAALQLPTAGEYRAQAILRAEQAQAASGREEG